MPRKPDLAEAKLKAGRFCAYQERSPKEVSDKLRSWGLPGDQIDRIVKELRKDGFVDPQRFANAFCNDKFEFNSWGKQKIKAKIFIHDLDGVVIEKALSRIDTTRYFHRMLELATKKWKSLSKEDLTTRKQKTLQHLTGKGFESELIWKAIDQLTGTDTK